MIFKLISRLDVLNNSCEITLIRMPQNLTDDLSTLIQVMVIIHHMSQCWPRSMSPYGVPRPEWVNLWLHVFTHTISNLNLHFNSLAPGKLDWNFRYVIFQWNFSDSWFRHLLWFCPDMNATGLHWWSVTIGSGNGLVSPGYKPLPEPMSSYDVIRPQWVKTSVSFYRTQCH